MRDWFVRESRRGHEPASDRLPSQGIRMDGSDIADPTVAAGVSSAAMRDLFRLVWSEPRDPGPPAPSFRDWLLVAGLALVAIVEVSARPELPHKALALALVISLLPTLVWRRSLPLAMFAVGFGTTAVVSAVRLLTDFDVPELHTLAFLLLLVYALFRWGAGREMVLGLPILLGSASLGLLSHGATPSDMLGALAVLLAATTLGAAVRYRARVRTQELEQVKMRERERLARELHDTVAHHVSAIAIRAQAGLATAPRDPAGAVDALRVIGTEASRSLAEMRAIVRLLRGDESAELAPSPRVADLERLADRSAGPPAVDVEMSGDLDDLSPSVSTALFRIAQESVTNARRHARGATRIRVGVTADHDSVHLRVCDDGEPPHARGWGRGYGLTGMIERAELLGGRCSAGPDAERGWTVSAVLPRKGAIA